ncbi:hypothetical protein DM02DRAFT_475175, partial [Periconia macrospinosa]
RSLTSIAWVACPLCGMLLQLVFRAISDNFQSRWGRQKPFILGGSIATATSITCFAWVNNVVDFVIRV